MKPLPRISLKGNSYITVSYTHLDVYKRQVASHERYLYRGYLQIAALDMLDNRNAVSYTHLDVYKRQP